MRRDDPIRALLSDLEAAAPPPWLGGRVLAAAGRALAAPAERGPWQRLSASRPLRLAWATCVAVLLVGHLALGIHRRADAASRHLETAARPGAGAELAAIAALPALDLATVTWEPVAPAAAAPRPFPDKESRQ